MDAYTHMYFDPPEPDPDQEPEPEAAELLTVTDDGLVWWSASVVAA